MVTGDAAIEDEVARLRNLDLSALRARWRVVTGKAAAKHLPRHLLLRVLAYRIQADARADLSRDSARLLDRIATGQGEVPPTVRPTRPGTVLVREWRGVHHHVMSDRDGYCWNGKHFRSLSEVAFAITGTRWSGPRFFGTQAKAVGSQDPGRPA